MWRRRLPDLDLNVLSWPLNKMLPWFNVVLCSEQSYGDEEALMKSFVVLF